MTTQKRPNKSLQATRDGRSSSASRFTLVGSACLSFGSLGRLHVRMKAWPFIFIVALVLVGCGHRDPIDQVVKKESANDFFGNGMYMLIPLPASASVTEVTSRALSLPDTNITVLETRQVRIHGSLLPPFTAVLADTGSGQKVILLQFRPDKQHPPGGWWSHVYDAKRPNTALEPTPTAP